MRAQARPDEGAPLTHAHTHTHRCEKGCENTVVVVIHK